MAGRLLGQRGLTFPAQGLNEPSSRGRLNQDKMIQKCCAINEYFFPGALFSVIILTKPEDHWSFIAHLSAEDILN